MITIFYINLAGRADRREFMQQQFDALGIAGERVEAVAIAEVPEALVNQNREPDRLWRVGPADLACGLSHQRIWRLLQDRGISEALVLEDDALLTPTLLGFLEEGILDRLGADIVKLETYRQKVLLGTARHRIGEVKLHELGSSHMGSAAYIIRGTTAATGLAHGAVNGMGIDRFLFGRGGPNLLRSRILQASPAPVVQLVLQDPANRSWQVWYDATGTARSDIAPTRDPSDFRGKSRPKRRPPGQFAMQLDHAGRIAGFLARDPKVIGRRRVRIGYTGDGR